MCRWIRSRLSKSPLTSSKINHATNAGRGARHIALDRLGATGQQRIESSTALIVGLGGIGCAVASYLASSSVGHLMLSDFDTIDATNLGRQVLYGPDDIGKAKTDAAIAKLAAINPDIRLTGIPERLRDDALLAAVSEADVVLDGCDNFATRFLINDACVREGTCLVSGAAIRFEGQVAVFGPDYESSPCYRCLYQEADESLENCSGNGVLASVPGVIGTTMATEALKHFAGLPVRTGQLNLYDAMNSQWRSVGIRKRNDCDCTS